MLKRLGSVIVLACLGLTFVATPSPAQADPYTASVNTRCRVTVAHHVVKVGNRARVQVLVQANGKIKPRGTVKITIRRKGGSVILRKTRAYRGRTVTVRSHRINRVGRYLVKVRFKDAPKAPQFRGCSASTSFRVKRTVGPNANGPGTGPNTGPNNTGPNNTGPNNTGPNTNVAPTSAGPSTPSGVLPDTGGPNVWWLVLGFGLVLGGVGLVAAGRRGRVVHAS